MTRLLLGFAICLAVGAVVALSGLGRSLPLDRAFVPPPVPSSWAAMPSGDRVDVTLVSSQGLVDAVARGLSGSGVALHRGGALALVDGRVIAVSGASVRRVLRTLAWDGLPIEARHATVEELRHIAAPAPASLAWRARHRAHAGLRSVREALAAYPSFTAASLLTALVLLLHAFLTDRREKRSAASPQPESTPWRRRRAEQPLRVVLVSDVDTLAQVRTAIGEENVIAATEHAFAFAGGWILASRKGSVFELASELGWSLRPLEMCTRAELCGEGHSVSPAPSDAAGDTLDLLEALRVCGPLAHGEPRAASAALSGA